MKTKNSMSGIMAGLVMIIGVLAFAGCSKKPAVGPSKGMVLLTKYKTWYATAYYFSNDQDSLKGPTPIKKPSVTKQIDPSDTNVIQIKSDGTYSWGPNEGTWKLYNNDSVLVLTPKFGNTLSYIVTISDGSFTMLYRKSSTPGGAYSYVDTVRDTTSPGYDYKLVAYTGSNK